MEKLNKIIKIISLTFIILGLVIFTVVITIGRTNESLQPTLTRLVQIYLYCTMLLTIINGLLGYIGRKK
ncbi:hypothetical protein [Romboutsia sp.]|uniref:hypothetical protein n=1 Tax=Romboutsia sp. TaxID=1965302 RepID=UPI002C311DA6|nr:hypothetical protein [Romboutsia sp.]HSQ90379.1 hypothetical protein [Romboutsia sp.]